MTNLDVKLLYEYHLSTWYLLPATGYKKTDFDPFHFINVFIANDYSYVYVRTTLPANSIAKPGTILMVLKPGVHVLCVPVDPIYKADFRKYQQGNFSSFSDRLLGTIIRNSSMAIEINFETGAVSIDLLMAALLSEHRYIMEEALADAMFDADDREFGLEMLKSGELLTKPSPSEFIEVL
jgi:hypothetical protein